MRSLRVLIILLGSIVAVQADPIYHAGVAPVCAGCVVGDHLIGGAHPSVAGVGGSGLSNNGDSLNGQRTYIYDFGGGPDLADGIANRGDAGFAMMIWDMGSSFDSIALYTHQDHYSGGPITTDFIAQDVMEYSVWGSNDGDNFVLLSDVTAFDLVGGGVGLPTYTFGGMAPNDIYRGGSTEFGFTNAYTRDYTFGSAYQYFGIRTSSISLAASDADPELDAILGHSGPIFNPVPEPGTLLLLGTGLLGLGSMKRKFRS